MEFSKRKLPLESVQDLSKVSIDTVKAYALMLSPVYVLLNENQKFVSVKAPLDFFIPTELKQLSPYQFFYFPRFVYSVLPFREAGKKVKDLLSLESEIDPKAGKNLTKAGAVVLPPAPFELSNLVLQIVGPLWWEYPGQGTGIEPFLVAVFANELCDLISSEKLIRARESNAEAFERAILRSAWAVFLALHLGYCDLAFLNEFRLRVFDETMSNAPHRALFNEVDEIVEISRESLKDSDLRLLKREFFMGRVEKVSQKLSARLKRVESEFLSTGRRPPSIYGEEGFIDG
jgi:hypothetical protein